MRRFLLIADFIASIFILLYISILFLFILLLRLIFSGKKRENTAIVVTSGTSGANAKRNIDGWYQSCLLDGYFDKIYFVYFIGDENRLSKKSPEVSTIDFHSQYARWLKERHFRFSSIIVQVAHFVYFLYHLAQSTRAKHFESNDPYIDGVCVKMASCLTGVPYFIRFNCDYDFYYREFGRLAFSSLRYRWIERLLSRCVLRKAKGVMALYEHYARSAIKEGSVPKKTAAIPPLLDISYWDDQSGIKTLQHPFAGEGPIMIYLGRLAWDKYCLDLVDVLAKVLESEPTAGLVILGDGDIRPQFEAKAKEKNVFERIYFPGFVTPEEIRAWGHLAKVMLATHGGFSLIELGAQGVPIVAYAHDWHAEIIHHEKTGLIAPFRDHQAMAAHALELFRDSKKARRLGDNLKSLVWAEYHPKVAKQKMRAFIQARLA